MPVSVATRAPPPNPGPLLLHRPRLVEGHTSGKGHTSGEAQPWARLASHFQKQPPYHNISLFKKHKPPFWQLLCNVSVDKELPPSSPLCSLTVLPSLMGKHMGAYPTGFPQQPCQNWQAPRSPDRWRGPSPGCPVPPLTQRRRPLFAPV